MGKINYTIDYSGENPQIDFDGTLSSEDIFFVHQLSKYLLMDIVVRERNKNENSDTSKFLITKLEQTIDGLSMVTDIQSRTLKDMASTEEELSNLLENLNIKKEDENSEENND